jgi:parallel beta-helix repeat protein
VLIDNGPTENVIGLLTVGNVISGNTKAGVQLDGGATTMNAVHGNRVGTNATGTAAVGNGTDGIFITGAPSNFAVRNVIGGNSGSGVRIRLSGATDNVIGLNQIGISGTLPIPNAGDGVTIDFSASDNSIRSGNVIAHNGARGVFIESGTGNAVRGNSIFLNGALGIDLAPGGPTPNDPGDGDSGANDLQNFPSVTVQPGGASVAGSLSSTPSTAFVIDIFDTTACDLSGYGEGEKYLGSVNVTTDASGNGTFVFTPSTAIPAGHFATATATDPSGDTSEFSRCGAKTADELTQDLVGQVQGLGLPTGTANSLVAKLQAALGSISAGDATTACNQLNAFINEVQAQSGKKIDAPDATALIQAAEKIKTELGCP